MKLGTLKSSHRDGTLVVISRDNSLCLPVPEIAPNLQKALDQWQELSPKLLKAYNDLNAHKNPQAKKVVEEDFHSPLPRAYAWMDGSAFIEHILLVRKSRNAAPPETLRSVPLMYQGGSDSFLAPREDIPFLQEDYGLDFEGEVGVILDDTPQGISAEAALKHIKLLVLINDVTLRGLVPFELAQGFGFFQSKPSSSFSPFALTPDELGPAWKGGRIHLPLSSQMNGQFFGNPDAGQMHFHFGELIAHAARTRDLRAGTILGSGTVSNAERARGSSCLAERRMIEQLEQGGIKTQFMRPGDTIQIEMHDQEGSNLFGTIKQKVVKK